MKLACWMVGKTQDKYLEEGIQVFTRRIQRYTPMEWWEMPALKNTTSFSATQFKEKEGELILQKLKPDDILVLLDEKGKHYGSEEFAHWLDHTLHHSTKRVIFLIGGAYGFSPAVYDRANAKLALSYMTFSHQMIRLFLAEQIYRAYTILRGEPYHNA